MTAPDVSAVFGRSVRSLRKERGWTLKQLSARCGLGYASISAIERGAVGASLHNAMALAMALGGGLDEMTGLMRASGPDQENRRPS